MSVDAGVRQQVIHSTDLPGLRPFIKGKVRDVYDLDTHLLIVATDRISAFDRILPTGIPSKGAVLNQISAFWFDHVRDICANHMVSIDADAIREAVRSKGGEAPDEVVAGRSMLVDKAQALPIEAVVRGYLEGSGWKEYQRDGSVCGIKLPPGLKQGSRLPEPIFTPSTKATEGHDQNITHEQMRELVDPDVADRVVRYSLEVYSKASDYGRERGIIIADTKFEFGLRNGEVILIDECLTPDSSRFWDAERWEPGGPQSSFDKQYVRDYLNGIGWNHEPPVPALPEEVAAKTSELYREIFTRLTGRSLA
jgi:phosphoribosylaminoimidazole-succinocarboxamide synthase